MILKGIISISGQTGLYKLVSHAKNSIIVESLETQKRTPAYSSSKISALEDIAIYTEDEDVPLEVIFKNIYTLENGGKAISHKASGPELKQYFEKALPNFDKERVYVSDIKKVINWYNSLQELGIVDLEDAPKDEEKTEQKVTEKLETAE